MERSIIRRSAVVIIVLALLMALFAGQLFRLHQAAASSGMTEQVKSLTNTSTVTAPRGSILDRDGNLLVSNRASYNVEISSYVLGYDENPNDSILEIINLCRQLGLEYTDNLPISKTKPYTYIFEEISGNYQSYYQDFLDYREMDWDMAAPNMVKELRKMFKIPDTWAEEDARAVIGVRYEIFLRKAVNIDPYILIADVTPALLADFKELGIPAVMVETVTLRQYHTDYAAHILGRVGLMDAVEYNDIYKEQDYPFNAKVGKDGVEKAFESYLHGTDGKQTITLSEEGEILNQTYNVLPQPGNNVMLTIDLEVQKAAEDALEDAILNLRENGVNEDKDGADATGGAVVAVDIDTFEVLASASYPTFNLETFSQDFASLNEDPMTPMVNRAMLRSYPPGSVYKMVPTIAGVDIMGIGRHYQIKDEGVYTFYEGYHPKCLVYTNFGITHGVINMMEALSVSCNYYFYEIGRQMGIEPMDQVAKSLGLGEPTGVEIGEAVGSRANPETKANNHTGIDAGWYGADTLMAAIGQSEHMYTPLQLATYTASLASQGVRKKATLLDKAVTWDYEQLLYEHEEEILSSEKFSDEAMLAVKEGMVMAATSGTAKLFANYPVQVAAKTGTAQQGSGGSDHGSLVCYAPADDPQIAIAIYVEHGAQGGSLAPIAMAVMDAYFQDSKTPNLIPENTLVNP